MSPEHAEPQAISVAIIGAGIGGITLAIALSRFNPTLNISIYEQREAFSEIGAGVGFGPNASKALAMIGPEVGRAYESIKTTNAWPDRLNIWYDFRTAEDGELVAQVEADKGYDHGGASRSQFLDNLVSLLPPDIKTSFSKKVTDVSENTHGKVKVTFSDSTSIEADAVIGCDGIRSACRRILLGDDDPSARAVYSGKYAYRKVVDMEKAVAVAGDEIRNRTIIMDHGGHILTFPIRAGKLLNIVAFKDAEGEPWTDHKWVVPSSREELLGDYKGWGKMAMGILELMDEPDKWALFDDPPSSTYFKGNFCLLGDAAHATTPHSGAGAGFCVEDSLALASALTPDIVKSAADIKYAFKAYDKVRRPRSQRLVTASRRQGMRLDLQKDDGSLLSHEQMKADVGANMKWVWEFDLQGMVDEVKQLARSYKDEHKV